MEGEAGWWCFLTWREVKGCMREDVGLSEAFLVLTARGGGWYSGAMDDPEKEETDFRRYAHDVYALWRFLIRDGISVHQVAVMCLLYQSSFGMSAGGMKEELGIGKSAFYSLLAKLKEEGYICLDNELGRAFSLTERGKNVVDSWRVKHWGRDVLDMFVLPRLLSRGGRSVHQVVVMCLLYRSKGGMNVREIHKKVHMSRESCYYLLAKLEEAGDVEYQYADPKEKKAGRLYGLTEQGRSMVHERCNEYRRGVEMRFAQMMRIFGIGQGWV